MPTLLTSLLSRFKLYIYAALAGTVVAGGLAYGHMRYEAGYTAAEKKQTDAIIAYQNIVVKKEQEHAAELAQLSSDHAAALEKAKAAIPAAQEKIRVVTKTIERPAVCTLVPDELRLINEAVHSANAAGAH